MLTLLGWVLTPLLLGSLAILVVMGLMTVPEMQNSGQIDGSPFLYGLKEGYNTMDLLAAFFFSASILNILRMRLKGAGDYLRTTLNASLIGAFLLAAIYVGFSYLTALHGAHLSAQSKGELLGALSRHIVGGHAGILVSIIVALACFTTAIALISAFADFIQQEVLGEKVSYEMTLLGSLMLTFLISTFEFTGISAFLEPITAICYPGLIVLTLLNIAYRLKEFKPVKVPVFSAFAVSAYTYFF